MRSLEHGTVVKLSIGWQPVVLPAREQTLDGALGAQLREYPGIGQCPVQAFGREHIDQRTRGDLQILDKVKAVHLCASRRHFWQIPAARRSGPADTAGDILQPMARKYPIDSGPRQAQRKRWLSAQFPLNSIGPILTERALITQPGPRLYHAPLQTRPRAIPGTTRFTISKQASIKPMIGTALNPQRYRAHIDPKLPGHLSHTAPGSHLSYHFTSPLFKEAFFAMINSPPKPLPYRSCWANAETQLLGER